MEDGAVRYGVRINVSLVSKSFPISNNPDWTSEVILTRQKAIIDSYSSFCKITAREREANPKYVIASTTSNLNGKFEFNNVDEGEYFILVDFPATIGMNKVVWQLPVSIKNDKVIEIELSNDNLAMPVLSEM